MLHEHRYQESIKEGIEYCKLCGALAFNKRPGQVLPFTNDLADMNIDPLRLKFLPAATSANHKNQSNVNYLRKKHLGIQRIHSLVNKFHLKRPIYYKAISFLNRIYLLNNPPLEDIESFGAMCLLLAMEFNQCCNKKDTSDNPSQLEKTSELKGFYNEVKNSMKNFKLFELMCLKYLDYDLGRYSAYDYLALFYRLGFIFGGPKLDMEKEFEKAINTLNIITDSAKGCDYSQYIIAMSIIKTLFKNNQYFNDNTFKYIYGVDLTKQKYTSCIYVINYLLLNHEKKLEKRNSLIKVNEQFNNTNMINNGQINHINSINNHQNIGNIMNNPMYNQNNGNITNPFYFLYNNPMYDINNYQYYLLNSNDNLCNNNNYNNLRIRLNNEINLKYKNQAMEGRSSWSTNDLSEESN